MLAARQSCREAVSRRTEQVSRIDSSHVADFARSLLVEDAAASIDIVKQLHRSGASLRSILLELLAPAARQLGTCWEDDSNTFAEVTLAMGRLQQVMHWTQEEAWEPEEPYLPIGERRALFRAVTGDQHTFALHILEAAFRRSGWLADVDLSPNLASTCRLAKARNYDVIGISIGRDSQLPALAEDIRAIRAATGRRPPIILVGGRAIRGRPERVAEVGADATADDAFAAVGLADRLMPVAAGY
jgi:methanogenic corrinoid protein MtbC1